MASWLIKTNYNMISVVHALHLFVGIEYTESHIMSYISVDLQF